MDKILKAAKFLLWYKNPCSFFRDIYDMEPYPYQAKVLMRLVTDPFPHRLLLVGAGGCIVEGTSIQLADGSFKNIECVQNKDRLLSYVNNEIVENSVLQLHDTGIQRVLKIRNKEGVEIIGTEDHPILTPDGYIALGKFYNQKHNLKAYFLRSYDIKDLDILDEEIILLASLISEGYYGIDQSPKVTNNNLSFLKYLSSISDYLFGIKGKIYPKEDGYDLVLSRGRSGKSKSPIIEWLRNLGIYGDVKEHKKLPEALFRMSNKQIQLFLEVLMFGDGGYSFTKRTDKYRFSIYTGLTLKLTEDLKLLLHRIGVFPKIMVRLREKSTAPFYELRFYALLNLFHRKIGTEISISRFYISKDMGKKHVYDIEMEGHYNYVANSMIVHNSGKTKMLACIALWLAVVYPKFLGRSYSVIIISGSKDQAKYLYEYSKFALQDTEELREEVEGEPMISVTYFQDRSLIMAVPNSLKAIQGKHMDCVIVDEGALAGDFVVQDTLRIVSTSDHDLIILSGTPMIYSSTFVEYSENPERYPEWEKYSWSAKDCPSISIEKWEEAKKLPEELFSIFWEGKAFAKMGTLIPTDEIRAASKDVPQQPIDPRYEIIAGLDWGFVHNTAIVIIQKNLETGLINVLYADAWRREEFKDIQEKIVQICKEYNVSRVFADHSDIGENQRLLDKGINLTPITFHTNKIPMQSHMKILFHQGKIRIPEVYQGLIQELRKYNWNTKVNDDYCDCYSEDTEILTKVGWKLLKDITYNDHVVVLKDGEICYEVPSNLIKFHYNGSAIQLTGASLNLLVTPNHKLYVATSKGANTYSDFKLVKAEQLIGKHFKCKKGGVWKGEDIEYFSLPYTATSKFHPFINRDIKIRMEDWLEFLGYYISEGHSGYNIVTIAQKEGNKKEIIRKCLNKLPFKWKECKYGIRCCSKQLGDYLKKLGKSKEKHMPLEVMSTSPRLLRILFDSLMLGDGYGTHYYTTSSILADQFQEISLKIGICGSKKIKAEINNGIINNRVIRGGRIYSVDVNSKCEPRVNHHINKHGASTLKIVPYNGLMYCITVPSHIIYVRRNGHPIWSGNSLQLALKGAEEDIGQYYWEII